MKAVLDTNVWLDWLVFADSSCKALDLAWRAGALVLPASDATRDEWLDVIDRSSLSIDPAVRASAGDAYDLRAHIVDREPGPLMLHPSMICRDADDRKFVELALAARSDFLVTRDKALLSLARAARIRHGLAIVSPMSPVWKESLLQGVPTPLRASALL